VEITSVTALLKERARALGFCDVGITQAVVLDTEAVHLEEWLGRGSHASMQWMAEHSAKRIDPRQILPNASSVISVAMNYHTDHDPLEEAGRGKISRYAWGDDYHEILKDRLTQLEAALKTVIPSAETKSFVDSGPMMDKAWAVRAGIGWLGKHSNVITKTHGSWVFLGEILTDAVLAYDAPIGSYCGTCTACIEACPTRAITQPYVVDARLCISYWTIEHRGDLDPSIANRLNGWVFGCDICQDVCPWKRFQKISSEPGFQPRQECMSPELEALTQLEDVQFARMFQRSPVKRAKNTGMKRNARAVLGNQRKRT
jgi:epoxyqueuosine reductase